MHRLPVFQCIKNQIGIRRKTAFDTLNSFYFLWQCGVKNCDCMSLKDLFLKIMSYNQLTVNHYKNKAHCVHGKEILSISFNCLTQSNLLTWFKIRIFTI